MPTAANGGITNGGTTYTFHIQPGVDWNTSPPRQVTASDFIREFKAFSNPASPVSATRVLREHDRRADQVRQRRGAYFAVKSHQATAANISNFQNTHTISGLSAPNPLTLKINLMAPASDFLYMMAMPFTSARPVEYDAYVPNSLQLDTHTISDGPYQITSYIAGKSLTMQPNPAWKQSTDPIRHQYVKEITETDGVASAQTQLADEQADTYDRRRRHPVSPASPACWTTQPEVQGLAGQHTFRTSCSTCAARTPAADGQARGAPGH